MESAFFDGSWIAPAALTRESNLAWRDSMTGRELSADRPPWPGAPQQTQRRVGAWNHRCCQRRQTRHKSAQRRKRQCQCRGGIASLRQQRSGPGWMIRHHDDGAAKLSDVGAADNTVRGQGATRGGRCR
jgi:hypothetical protein